MMGLSFIVPVYNGEKTLKSCLDSILSQDFDGPFEVIVVDNESTDKTSAVCSEYSELIVLKAPGIRNRSRARNIGALKARYSTLAFIDCDVVLAKDWASTLLRILKKPFGAAQTTILTKYRHKVEETHLLSPSSPFQTMDSCALMIPKETFLEVGGFEETLPRWEDSHFTLKLMSHGYGLMVLAPSKVTKFEDRNFFQLYKRIYETGRAEGIALKAWFQNPSPLLTLSLKNFSLKTLIQSLGNLTAERREFPPLRSEGGWTFVDEAHAISKYLNILVAPDFVCIKSRSNNVVHTIPHHHPTFNGLIKKISSGENFWHDLFKLIPEDSLILRRNMNEN